MNAKILMVFHTNDDDLHMILDLKFNLTSRLNSVGISDIQEYDRQKFGGQIRISTHFVTKYDLCQRETYDVRTKKQKKKSNWTYGPWITEQQRLFVGVYDKNSDWLKFLWLPFDIYWYYSVVVNDAMITYRYFRHKPLMPIFYYLTRNTSTILAFTAAVIDDRRECFMSVGRVDIFKTQTNLKAQRSLRDLFEKVYCKTFDMKTICSDSP